MLGKTFETIFKKPIILLGFLAVLGIPMLASIPYINFYLKNINEMMMIDELSTTQSLNLLITAAGYYAWIFIALLFVAFLVAPSVTGYVNDVVTGKPTKHWYIWGLKAHWWKIPVTSIIFFGTMGFITFVLGMLMTIPILGIFAAIALFVIYFSFSIYYIIALTSTISEHSYRAGLANIFKFGKKYFWRMFGTLILFTLPTVLFSIGYGIYVVVMAFSQTGSIMDMANVVQVYTPAATRAMVVVMVISAIYMVFYSAYIYTYSMYSYEDVRNKYFKNQFEDAKYTQVTNRNQ